MEISFYIIFLLMRTNMFVSVATWFTFQTGMHMWDPLIPDSARFVCKYWIIDYFLIIYMDTTAIWFQ